MWRLSDSWEQQSHNNGDEHDGLVVTDGSDGDDDGDDDVSKASETSQKETSRHAPTLCSALTTDYSIVVIVCQLASSQGLTFWHTTTY